MGSLEYDKAMQEAGREAAQERVRQLEGVLAEARRWGGGRRVGGGGDALRLIQGGRVEGCWVRPPGSDHRGA